VPPQGGRKHPQQEFLQVDTTNILFICGGAFAGLERIINQRSKGTGIGFGATVRAPDDRRTGAVLRELEPEDLLKFGLIPEFVGRLPVDGDAGRPRRNGPDADPGRAEERHREAVSAPVRDGRREAHLPEEALQAIARRAIERKTGARGLRSIMEGILLDTMFDLPGMTGVEEVVISREVVEGDAKPLLIYSDRRQAGPGQGGQRFRLIRFQASRRGLEEAPPRRHIGLQS
jgi:ATP-dependent Clp protease ATP-binding subunit ClpX